ncbi:MAG TPA: leucyl aminopeptidase family protein [Allosphingosinicella sp.]|jgi:leucyl aminopeptidase
MTDLSALLRPDQGQPANALILLDRKGLEPWLKAQPERVRRAAETAGFEGKADQFALVPGDKAADWAALLGAADAADPGVWGLAKAADLLPAGSYRLAGRAPGPAALGWLLAQYRFDRYKAEPAAKGPRILLSEEPARIAEALLMAEATNLVRDLVNIPAQDMGPDALESAVSELAKSCSAALSPTSGAELEREYPLIHAVGRAAAPGRGPRLLELEWGDPRHPRLALIGKGVAFDTGGLDIKNSAGMRLMKKDMGGAAHAIALALLVMKSRLPVRLHLLVPAVENAIAGNAFRPGDILKSRKGVTVEVHNTDAEGRLILADALTRAAESRPDLILDFATLTGAARVALGPDLPAMFANRDDLAAALLAAGEAEADPVWRMPLWKPYREMLASDVADLANASDAPMAGAVTAALFLQKFVPDDLAWAHFDTFAWRAAAKPGRPKGGDALGLRAAWAMLRSRYRA